jgi:hypothetical protein
LQDQTAGQRRSTEIELPCDPRAGQPRKTPHRGAVHRGGEHFDQKIRRNIPRGTPLVHGCEVI